MTKRSNCRLHPVRTIASCTNKVTRKSITSVVLIVDTVMQFPIFAHPQVLLQCRLGKPQRQGQPPHIAQRHRRLSIAKEGEIVVRKTQLSFGLKIPATLLLCISVYYTRSSAPASGTLVAEFHLPRKLPKWRIILGEHSFSGINALNLYR